MIRILVLLLWCGGALLLGGCDSTPDLGAPGSRLPEMQLTTLDGKKISTGELTGKGVILNFWATWCGPCRDEMPSLERLRRTLDSEKFSMIGVTLDEDPNLVREFLLKHGITFPIALDPERRQAGAAGVRTIPVTLLVGPDGVIRERLNGERRWDDPVIKGRILALQAAP